MASTQEVGQFAVEADGAPVGWVQRLMGLGWKIWTGIVLSSLSLATGLVVALHYASRPPIEDLSTAWESLKEDDYLSARLTATQFLDKGKPTKDEIGDAAYIIGRCLCGEADSEWNADRRKGLYLVASRYLLESYQQGFPDGTNNEAVYYLALSTYESGRETASLPFWKELEDLDESSYAESLPLYLARIYLHDAKLDSTEGLRYIEQYLKTDGLLPEQRVEGNLDRAALMLDVGQWDDGIAILDSLEVSTGQRPRKQLILGRLLLEKANGIRAELQGETDMVLIDPPEDAATRVYQRAIDELISVRTSLTEGTDEANQSIYYLARSYRALGDLEKAEFHFSEVRRDELLSPIGWAAGIEEAYLQYVQGKLDLAVENLLRVFSDETATAPYDNPWIDKSTVVSRIEAILTTLMDQTRFENAIELATLLWPPLPRDLSMDWQAKVQKQWGTTLVEQAERLQREGAADFLKVKKQGLAHLRLAGDAFAKLAKLRQSYRTYSDHLWEAADAYLIGHDYQQAIELYEKLLEENPSNRLARLYLKLGEAHFAQGDPESALTVLRRGVRERPNDPDTYKSRLLASRIHLSQNEVDTAKQLLKDNLEQELLSPASIDWRESLFSLNRVLFQEAAMLEAESRALGVDTNDVKRQEEGLEKLEESFTSFQETIQGLEEGVQRYNDDLPMFEQRYLLAESYRMAAQWPYKKAKTVTVTSTRFRLEAEADTYLQNALDLYTSLMEDISLAQDAGPITKVEERLLRNCYFNRADMYFQMEDLPNAIEAYKSAANRYHDRPESLEAFVRLASCYRRMERYDDARGVLAQAKLFLQERIPPTADFTKTTRYSRDEWDTFLDFLTTL